MNDTRPIPVEASTVLAPDLPVGQPRPASRPWLLWSLRVGVVSFVATMLLVLLLSLFLTERSTEIERLARRNPAGLMAVLLIAPFIETLIGQWLPIAIVGFFTRSAPAKIVISSIVFASLHLGNSLTNALVVLFVAGPILAWTFVGWRRISRWKGYLVTTATHFVHNLCAGILILATI